MPGEEAIITVSRENGSFQGFEIEAVPGEDKIVTKVFDSSDAESEAIPKADADDLGVDYDSGVFIYHGSAAFNTFSFFEFLFPPRPSKD